MGLFAANAATGLYRLHAGDAVTCELLSLQAGLDLLGDRIAALERMQSPARMDRAQLTRLLRLFGVPAPDEAEDEDLRRAVQILSVPCGCGIKALEAFLQGLGAQISLTEEPERQISVTGAVGGVLRDSEALCAMLVKLLPPGTRLLEEIGVLTWTMLDAYNLPFRALNVQDKSWSWLEASGHLLENMAEEEIENG